MPALAGLGPLRFEVSDLNIQTMERSFMYRWVPQNRLGRRPAQQFIGAGEEVLNLKGTIYPEHPMFAGAFENLNSMRQRAASGQFFNFGANIRGVGVNGGRWCVRKIDDVQTFFSASGRPMKVEFTIELVEYGADGASFLGIF